MAELGIVVVHLAGLGSYGRSKAFTDFLHDKPGDFGLPDQLAGLRQLAARFAWIDTTRVAIMGHSAGAPAVVRALLEYPDVF